MQLFFVFTGIEIRRKLSFRGHPASNEGSPISGAISLAGWLAGTVANESTEAVVVVNLRSRGLWIVRHTAARNLEIFSGWRTSWSILNWFCLWGYRTCRHQKWDFNEADFLSKFSTNHLLSCSLFYPITRGVGFLFCRPYNKCWCSFVDCWNLVILGSVTRFPWISSFVVRAVTSIDTASTLGSKKFPVVGMSSGWVPNENVQLDILFCLNRFFLSIWRARILHVWKV